MSLDRGESILPEDFRKKVVPSNLRTLSTWMSVGADTEYGKFAMLGARIGCYNTVFEQTDIEKVRDLDELQKVYEEYTEGDTIDSDLLAYGESIRQRLEVPVAEYDENESKFFKFAMATHKNVGVQARERE